MVKQWSKIGIGTSMLFNGVLRSDLNDSQRKVVMLALLNSEINVIHTNAKLGTQEKACRYLREISRDIIHITKTEASLESVLSGDTSPLLSRIENTIKYCPFSAPQAVSLEIDHKDTCRALNRVKDLSEWYKRAIDLVSNVLGYTPFFIAMCKSEAEFEAALSFAGVDYVGGYTNIKQTGLLNQILQNKCHKPVIGFSPFARGRIISTNLPEEAIKLLTEAGLIGYRGSFNQELIYQISYRIPVSCQEIKTLVTGIGTEEHRRWAVDNSNAPAIDRNLSKAIIKLIAGNNHRWK